MKQPWKACKSGSLMRVQLEDTRHWTSTGISILHISSFHDPSEPGVELKKNHRYSKNLIRNISSRHCAGCSSIGFTYRVHDHLFSCRTWQCDWIYTLIWRNGRVHKTCLGPKLKTHDVLIPILCRISGHFSTIFLVEGTAKVSLTKGVFPVGLALGCHVQHCYRGNWLKMFYLSAFQLWYCIELSIVSLLFWQEKHVSKIL